MHTDYLLLWFYLFFSSLWSCVVLCPFASRFYEAETPLKSRTWAFFYGILNQIVLALMMSSIIDPTSTLTRAICQVPTWYCLSCSTWNFTLDYFFPRNLFSLISKYFFLVLFHFRIEIILESYLVAKVVLFTKVLSTLVQSSMI